MSDWSGLLVELASHEPSFAVVDEARERASLAHRPPPPPNRWRGRLRLAVMIAAVTATVAGVLVVLALAAQSRSSDQPANHPAARPTVTPVSVSAHNGPVDVYGYLGGGVRRVSANGRVTAFTVHCHDCAETRGAAWSDDGRVLVYSASCSFGSCGEFVDPTHGIRVFDSTTGADRRIVPGEHLGPLSVSADGSQVVYADGPAIRVVATDGSGPPTTVVAGDQNLFRNWIPTRPTWSPDRKWIAYVQNHRVYTVAADGTNRRLLARGDAAAWSPDGRWIAFWWQGEIRLITPAGADAHSLTRHGVIPGSTLRHGVSMLDLSWSPDARQIVLMRGNAFTAVSASTGTVERRETLRYNQAWFPDGVAWRPVR